MASLKRKDRGPDADDVPGPDADDVPGITADAWEGDLSGHETEKDETMEEDENDGQLESAGHVNTPQLVRRRLTAASRFTNQVCDHATDQIDQNNH